MLFFYKSFIYPSCEKLVCGSPLWVWIEMMKSFSQCAFSLHKCNQLRFVQHQSALLRRIKKCSPTSFQCKIIFKCWLSSQVKIIKKETPVHYISIVLHYYIIVNVNISHTSLYAMYDITVFNSSNNAVNKINL